MKVFVLFAVFTMLLGGMALGREPVPDGYFGMKLGCAMSEKAKQDFVRLCREHPGNRPSELSRAVKLVSYLNKDARTGYTPFNTRYNRYDDFSLTEGGFERLYGRDVIQAVFFYENDQLSRIQVLLGVEGQEGKQELAKTLRKRFGKSSVVCEDTTANRALYVWRVGDDVFSINYDVDNFVLNVYSLRFSTNLGYHQRVFYSCDDPL